MKGRRVTNVPIYRPAHESLNIQDTDLVSLVIKLTTQLPSLPDRKTRVKPTGTAQRKKGPRLWAHRQCSSESSKPDQVQDRLLTPGIQPLSPKATPNLSEWSGMKTKRLLYLSPIMDSLLLKMNEPESSANVSKFKNKNIVGTHVSFKKLKLYTFQLHCGHICKILNIYLKRNTGRTDSVIMEHCLVKIVTNWLTPPHTITSENTVHLETSQKSQTKP